MRCAASLCMPAALLAYGYDAGATEGAMGRPVAGTGVTASAGIVPPAPTSAVIFAELYLDGSIGGSRQVPVAGEISLGIQGELAYTMATLFRAWGPGGGAWSFASSITVPWAWTRTTATLGIGGNEAARRESVSGLYDLYFTPIVAGYHLSETQHVSVGFNMWAPTGSYDPAAIANLGLNVWTFIPQVAYTGVLAQHGIELDAVAGLQFYTRNSATDYRNAPLFTLDLMALKRFPNGVSAGVIVGTVQQLGKDSGRTADRLDGFVGRDWAAGPIVYYDTRIAGQFPLTLSLRWVPTVSSRNRLDSTSTFLGSLSLLF